MNALDQLLTFERFGWVGVNERMAQLCAPLMSTPWWQSGRCIKVAGSNGKGSTATLMSLMAMKLGNKVGLYTSPHLLKVNERIQMNGDDILDIDLESALVWALDQAHGLSGVGRFEILTAASLYHFAQNNVDLAVMEVGLGGRFDPVRISPGKISVLTSVDLEHTQILGHTIEDIITEKAAICKSGDTLLSAVPDISPFLPEGVRAIERLHLDPFLSNQGLAAHALKQHLNLHHTPDFIFDFKMAARMQCLSLVPLVYVDVAHSPQAVQSVVHKLAGKRITLICGARHDKDMQAMADVFSNCLDHVIAFNPEEGMLPEEDVLNSFGTVLKNKASSAAQAFELAQKHLAQDSVILCLGGFALASHMIAFFHKQKNPSFIRL